MALYTTRVELHGGTYTDYETLHKAMELEGFERTITSSDRKTYHLPTAEYYRNTSPDRSQASESGKRAAGKTQKSYGVIVAEAERISWKGLTAV